MVHQHSRRELGSQGVRVNSVKNSVNILRFVRFFYFLDFQEIFHVVTVPRNHFWLELVADDIQLAVVTLVHFCHFPCVVHCLTDEVLLLLNPGNPVPDLVAHFPLGSSDSSVRQVELCPELHKQNMFKFINVSNIIGRQE